MSVPKFTPTNWSIRLDEVRAFCGRARRSKLFTLLPKEKKPWRSGPLERLLGNEFTKEVLQGVCSEGCSLFPLNCAPGKDEFRIARPSRESALRNDVAVFDVSSELLAWDNFVVTAPFVPIGGVGGSAKSGGGGGGGGGGLAARQLFCSPATVAAALFLKAPTRIPGVLSLREASKAATGMRGDMIAHEIAIIAAEAFPLNRRVSLGCAAMVLAVRNEEAHAIMDWVAEIQLRVDPARGVRDGLLAQVTKLCHELWLAHGKLWACAFAQQVLEDANPFPGREMDALPFLCWAVLDKRAELSVAIECVIETFSLYRQEKGQSARKATLKLLGTMRVSVRARVAQAMFAGARVRAFAMWRKRAFQVWLCGEKIKGSLEGEEAACAAARSLKRRRKEKGEGGLTEAAMK